MSDRTSAPLRKEAPRFAPHSPRNLRERNEGKVIDALMRPTAKPQDRNSGVRSLQTPTGIELMTLLDETRTSPSSPAVLLMRAIGPQGMSFRHGELDRVRTYKTPTGNCVRV